MDHLTNQKQVILNFSEKYCKNEIEVLNSSCFREVWGKFLDHIYKAEKQDVLSIIELLPNPKKDYVILFKLLLEFEIQEIKMISVRFKQILEHSDILYELIEDFYDYWRRLERYGLIYSKSRISGVETASFTTIMNQFTNVILSTYRTICQKVLGEGFSIYRSLPAGVNAGLLISKHNWMGKESKYSFLSKSPVLEQVLIRPPFISYSAKNKRTGIYEEVFQNPIDAFSDNFKAEDYYCYSARVGSALAYVYFHRDFLAQGITLCNLFEFVPLHKCLGQKPDLLYIFGANIEGDSVFYHDKEEDIYVGVAPHNASVDYFGYMKKMLLTLYNVKMIDHGNLPLHGACVSITMKTGTTKNVVIIGDSGAGKSESLEALSEYAGEKISSLLTVFDDMGTLKLVDGEVYAYGTEIGAFVRLDDMSSGYAYREMDRAIFMNPDKTNSRLVIPVATYNQIMKGYKVDMVLYANNYEDEEQQLKIFTKEEDALKTFTRGARFAKGTTQEIGLVESFFANPFGPVQRENQTRKLLDIYFQKMFELNIPVGELYTKLGILGKQHEGPAGAAKKLFEILEK
ncbi:MAG: hypothetical protein K2K15_01800 [Anaeroplasmataceae bacterium]|nr:hypothetical protein [Anaeroplasmataceae bacterium]